MTYQRTNWKKLFQDAEIVAFRDRTELMEQKQLNTGLQNALDASQAELKTRSTRSEVAVFMLIMVLGGLGFGLAGGMHMRTQSIKAALEADRLYDGGDFKIQGLIITPEMPQYDTFYKRHIENTQDLILGPDGREYYPVESHITVQGDPTPVPVTPDSSCVDGCKIVPQLAPGQQKAGI